MAKQEPEMMAELRKQTRLLQEILRELRTQPVDTNAEAYKTFTVRAEEDAEDYRDGWPVK
jgi:hypothetical protein